MSMKRDIDEVRLYPDYTLIKYRDVQRHKYEYAPEWGLITDPDILDFVEFCQEKGEVWYQGQFTGYRRMHNA